MATAGNFSFVLNAAANTSAGVYDSTGQLIRTIWSIKPLSQVGQYTGVWDGNDDFGNVATGGPFTIKILSSNTGYNWDGVVGNTSVNFTGADSMIGYDTPKGMAATSNFLYSPVGYSEFGYSTWKRGLNTLNQITRVESQSGTNQVSCVCTDGINVYWGNIDAFSQNNTFVYATACSNDAKITFASGTGNYTQTFGNTYSTIGLLNQASSNITGIAVQASHNFLFVARSALNQLTIYNKTTGAIVQTVSLNNCAWPAVDSSDNLWIFHDSVVEKYTVNPATGAITTASITISIALCGAIAINQVSNIVLLADMNAQQINAYATSGGAPIWTLGTGSSYASGSTVANNKFYWKDNSGTYLTYLCWMPDGSFMVGDQKNYRTQHFAANQTFIETIAYIGHFYACWVNQNNTTRVFANTLEFSIDYSKSVGKSWTLLNNWGGNYLSTYDQQGYIVKPITLSNGRTYCFVKGVITNYLFYLCELVNGGVLRVTTHYIGDGTIGANTSQGNDAYIETDGSLVQIIYNFTNCIINRFLLTGFDGSNNPTWNTTPTSITTTPTFGTSNVFSPIFASNSAKTSNGHIVNFDPSVSNTGSNNHGFGYHIQSLAEGSTAAKKWATAINTLPNSGSTYSGPYPGRGIDARYFDSGNGVVSPGSFYGVNGNNIIWGYNGEFWKSSEVNMYQHIDDNTGLMAGQFGVTDVDFGLVKVFAPAGAAGNALSGSVISGSGNTLYLYHCDESYHGGIHRWSINNINTISSQVAVYPFAPPSIPTPADLTAGLVRGATLTNGTASWLRSPSADYNNASGVMTTAIGSMSIDPDGDADVYLNGSVLQANTSFYVSRPIPNSGSLSRWTIAGQCYYFNIQPTFDITAGGGGIIQILDPSGKCIIQMFIGNNLGTTTAMCINTNSNFLASITGLSAAASNALYDLWQSWQNFSFSYANGAISVNWAGYSLSQSTTSDAGADMTSPATFRLYFFCGSNAGGNQAVGHYVSIKNLTLS
jgi:hypothetical protein